MDLASVVAALASVGVRVSGSTPNNNIQGDSSRACPTGLAGPEPSGTHNDPGQHFHDAFRFSASTAHTKHYRPRANERDNRCVAIRLLLHQDEVEDLLLNEATVRNEMYSQASQQCESSFKAIIELHKTCLRQTIQAESVNPFTLFYHFIEANALLRFRLHDKQQCTFRSLVCEAWIAEHQYIIGKLYASYIKLLINTLEDFELTVRGVLKLQAFEKTTNQEPQPPSWADQTDLEENFWNLGPFHHTSVTFDAIFSVSQGFIS